MNLALNIIEKLFFPRNSFLKVLDPAAHYVIFRVSDQFILDIPKSGSSTLKYHSLLQQRSFRYHLLSQLFSFHPVHNALRNLGSSELGSVRQIHLFLRDPYLRLRSTYRQKVLNKKEYPFGCSPASTSRKRIVNKTNSNCLFMLIKPAAFSNLVS